MDGLMTEQELRDLAARASTLRERLVGGFVAAGPDDRVMREAARARLAAWGQAAAAGNRELFAALLAQDELDEAAALSLLGAVRLAHGQPLPEWAAAFEGIAAALAQAAAPADPPPEETAPVPFAELLWPAILAADKRLAERSGAALPALFAPPARAGLRWLLLRRLSAYCAPALFWEFSAFRDYGSSRLPAASAEAGTGEPPRRIYDAFVADWRRHSHAFFAARPVLARIVATAVLNWLAASEELVERLAHDHAALGDAFAGGRDLGPVTSLETGLPDPHRGGRAVAILGFGDGAKIVYKPKDLRIDIAWAALLRWLDDNEAPVLLKAPAVIARDDYGWAAFVPADDPQAAPPDAAYHRRAGALLALFHLLQGADFHHENVIISGGYPIPVDLETLLHPRRQPPNAAGVRDLAMAAAERRLKSSVLTTLYLPQWVLSLRGGPIAIGGLDRPPQRNSEDRRFRHVNTDAMEFADGAGPPPQETHPAGPEAGEYAGAVADGFAEMYRFVMHNRDALLDADGPLRRFAGVRVRQVRQPTGTYFGLLWRAAAPANLSDGVDWSLHFEFLARGLLIDGPTAPDLRAVACEQVALTRLDIPFFRAVSDDCWLDACDGTRIEGALAAAPLESALAHAASMDEDDLAFQLRIINATLPGRRRSAVGRTGGQTNAPDSDAAGLDAARQIGETLARGAIRSDGSAAWIGTVLLDHDHSTLGVCGPDLCSGSAGIALFLAALARATRDAHFRDLAEAALRPVRVMLGAADGGARAARTLGLGAGSGIASIIYVLSHLSRLLHDPHLLSGARGLARLIDPDLIAADRSYDALAGAAGAILVLLTLHRATEDPADLERAVICGQHLLRRQVTDGPAAAWPTLPHKVALPIGMAHGTAGIALALLRLYDRTGEETFRAAGAAALAHERRGFIASASNWPMTPDSEGGILLCQWCYGAPGIGLSRLAMLDLIDDPDLPGEIDAAIRTTLAASPAHVDYPCCGNCGQIEFLLSAGRRLKRPELIAAARARLGALLDGWTARGGFRLLNSDDGFNPGFFQGISGIGYTILRVARPASFPNALIWE
jgi:type 2 lantibiotic biosynthesis protein LanM